MSSPSGSKLDIGPPAFDTVEVIKFIKDHKYLRKHIIELVDELKIPYPDYKTEYDLLKISNLTYYEFLKHILNTWVGSNGDEANYSSFVNHLSSIRNCKQLAEGIRRQFLEENNEHANLLHKDNPEKETFEIDEHRPSILWMSLTWITNHLSWVIYLGLLVISLALISVILWISVFQKTNISVSSEDLFLVTTTTQAKIDLNVETISNFTNTSRQQENRIFSCIINNENYIIETNASLVDSKNSNVQKMLDFRTNKTIDYCHQSDILVFIHNPPPLNFSTFPHIECPENVTSLTIYIDLHKTHLEFLFHTFCRLRYVSFNFKDIIGCTGEDNNDIAYETKSLQPSVISISWKYVKYCSTISKKINNWFIFPNLLSMQFYCVDYVEPSSFIPAITELISESKVFKEIQCSDEHLCHELEIPVFRNVSMKMNKVPSCRQD